jgi:hypothetical protein
VTLFDELRGAVVDLPTGTILPGWVEKATVIRMLDRIEAEHEQAPYDRTCSVCRDGGHSVPPPHRMRVTA